MKRNLIQIVCGLCTLLVACNNNQEVKDHKTDIKTDTARALVQQDWRHQFDLDGDYRRDSISYSYTGGAHCCYQLTVYLTKTNSTRALPFFIEGGYIVFDLSQPENFDIQDKNGDKVHEIYLNLEHYETDRSEKELKELQNKYHFIGTRIEIRLDTPEMVVKDI